ncbi:hypothetical protein MNVI_18920 [Mycobacterium noviomagense]|uniref:Uncharacterized protein n=1 Tax=Mycobacterium noviomagense TaxID=459858 RepID=A0A7I7PD75_9MYCO|nr:hypothetical protein MNVI_18920 [Mycobacterium noviomagense]
MNEPAKRAVVCGAGMAGLFAARVLSEFYETVTLVERDRLTSDESERRGVPQGRHFHALSIGGFPTAGAIVPRAARCNRGRGREDVR